MQNPDLYWFRTRQELLEEWGYSPRVWHLVRRSSLSLTLIALDAHCHPRDVDQRDPREANGTRVPLALIDMRLCDVIGPFSIEGIPRVDASWDDSRGHQASPPPVH